MLNYFTLKQKFLIISFVMILSVGLVTVLSQQIVREMFTANNSLKEITSVVRNHMEGDMMHDAIRSDVYKALLGAVNSDMREIDAAEADLKDHGDRFLKNVDKNLKASLPEDVQDNIAKSKEQIEEYITTARNVIALSRTSYEQARSAYRNFLIIFQTLEESQAGISDKIEEWAGTTSANQQVAAEQKIDLILILSLFTIVIVCVIPILVIFSVFQPQEDMIQIMSALARGQKNTEVRYTRRKDEIGDIARAVQVFKETLIKIDQMHDEQHRQQVRTEEEKKRALQQLADDFERTLKTVVETVTNTAKNVNQSAISLSKSAESSGQRSTELERKADEASRNVATVATAAEELAASIQEINRQVSRSTQVSRQAVSNSEEANSTVKALSTAASKIGVVLNLINEIVEQINLLALNATIEAARAGEAGKGFAVVASEVKNLANQTTKATEEIRESINSIQDATQDTVGKIQSIGQVIMEMNEIATAIASAVEEQGAATEEIARSTSQASDGTQVITQNIREVAKAIRETSDTSQQMLNASGNLAGQADIMTAEVHNFLAKVRRG